MRVHILYKYTENNTGCPANLNSIWRNCEESKRIRKCGSFIYTDREGVPIYIKVSVCSFYFHMTVISTQNVLLLLVTNFMWGIHFLTGFGEVFCLVFCRVFFSCNYSLNSYWCNEVCYFSLLFTSYTCTFLNVLYTRIASIFEGKLIQHITEETYAGISLILLFSV